MIDKPDNKKPEKMELRFGFIPLTDCCVLIIAKEKGFFEKYGLDVTLSKEASWANIRDKVCFGALDGAQMLAGIPIATTLGLGFARKDMLTAFSMDLNGNAITLSNELYDQMLAVDSNLANNRNRSADVLKQVIEEGKSKGSKPLTFAVVYPFSNHNYQLRYWMAAAGIDPDQDVRLITIPPQYMVENICSGVINGFCAGGPWNAYAVKEQAGKVITTGYDIWNNAPEKVFGVTKEWAEKYPVTHKATIKALVESAKWIDKTENREEVAEIISAEKYVGISKEIIKMSLTGTIRFSMDSEPVNYPDFNVFYRYLANFPWCSHAAWIITQMYRWGQLDQVINIKNIAEKVYRPDIFRSAAGELGSSLPDFNYKTEGQNKDKWLLGLQEEQVEMGSDSFIDGKVFDPDNLCNYLDELGLNSLKIDLDKLKQQNL